MNRWEVTLERWSASRGFPSFGRARPHLPPRQLKSAAAAYRIQDLGFRVQGLWFRVQGAG